MSKQKRILITGGGTFGHIAPALTLKHQFEKADWDVTYICAKRDMKFPFYQKEKKVKNLALSGLPRGNKLKLIWFSLKLVKALIVALVQVLKIRPKVVLATGGFVTFPYLFWAYLMRKKIYLCEQNSFPGLVNRLFAGKAQHVFTSMADQSAKLGGKKSMSGNPVEVNRYDASQAAGILGIDYQPGKKFLGILGGSQGADAINCWVIREQYSLIQNGWQIVMSVGQKHYQELKDQVIEGVKVFPFIENMGAFYSLCDAFISRSGASSIAEYFHFMKPVIFIPYPFASDNHQFYNARFALDYLPGQLILEKELDACKAMDILLSIQNKDNNTENPFPDPARIILEQIEADFNIKSLSNK